MRRGIEVAPHALHCLLAVAIPAQHAQLFGMGHMQPLEQQLLADGDDGGVGSDGKCERSGGDGSEAGAPAQDAQAVAHVGGELVPPAEAEGSAHAFLVNRNRAEGDAGAACGFRRGMTGADQVFGQAGQVGLQFCLHVGFEIAAANYGAEPGLHLR